MAVFEGADVVGEHLSHLADALELEDADRYELLVCGGAALATMGLVERATDDVDVLALVVDGEEVATQTFPDDLRAAVHRVAKADDLPDHWLNLGPADMNRAGLPDGIVERAHTETYGKLLDVHFLARIDQIHLKLYASLDKPGGKHTRDLEELNPTADELERASRWVLSRDEGDSWPKLLEWFLKEHGHGEVVERLSE